MDEVRNCEGQYEKDVGNPLIYCRAWIKQEQQK